MQRSTSAPTTNESVPIGKAELVGNILAMMANPASAGHLKSLDLALRNTLPGAIAEAHELYAVLETQWAWLWGYRDGHEALEGRTDRFEERLREYAALEDAIGHAQTVLGIDTPRSKSWQDRHRPSS